MSHFLKKEKNPRVNSISNESYIHNKKDLGKASSTLSLAQCDEIGRFLQILGNKLSQKVAQIFWCLFGLFLIMSLSCKKCVDTRGDEGSYLPK